MTAVPDAAQTLALAFRLSRYASRAVTAQPDDQRDLEAHLEQPFTRAEMDARLAAAPQASDAELKRALRRLRRQVMLRLIARDLSGRAELTEVMTTATDLAEATIGHALSRLHRALAEAHGEPIGRESGEPGRLIVMGMGKLGGGELNVSSDIDLIFVYPEDGDTAGPRVISNLEFFTTLGRRLIAALHEPTADGFVFRVDMRLRPYGESGPLVCTFAQLENYFLSQGREWERYAWIKARPLSGDRLADLDQLVRPFVYRKYLDFGAFESMRKMHRQIRQEVTRRDMDTNIKLGPGGIREVEFTAQVFQLIRGGHEPELRVRATRGALARLARRGFLPEAAARELLAAYDHLRRLEHRLQYLDDAQTQNVPRAEADQALVAEAMGLGSWDELMTVLGAHRDAVTRHFEDVFTEREAADEGADLSALWMNPGPGAAERLGELGYRSPEPLVERLKRLRESSRYRGLPAASQRRLDALVPRLLAIAAPRPNPDDTVDRVLGVLETVARRGAYLALLQEYPQAFESLARLASASRWAAEYLAGHPILLDEFLDPRLLNSDPDWPALGTHLDLMLADAADDPERQMDILRHFRHAHTFRLLARDLGGLLTLEALSDHLSALADLILEKVLALTWAALPERHREEPLFAIVGYGKLGGKELGYASDLDIVFVHDDPAPEALEHYSRLGLRINSWLSSFTGAGILYETDLRLRPDGASGLMASSLESFAAYQRDKAWVWEHQALTRARFCAGNAEIGQRFEEIRVQVLRTPRDLATLRAEVVEMRQKMLDGHPNKTELFDVKHDRGGIVDVEFVVQYLVLGHSHAHEDLAGNKGNLALLAHAADLGLIDPYSADQARRAYRQYRQWQHALRLQGAKYARVDPEQAEPHVRAVLKLWDEVIGGD